jgi:hypothetical protein
MDKKGFTFFSDMINVIFIIVILTIFSFVMFVIDKSNWDTQEIVVGDLCAEIRVIEGNYMLLNYLRTSVDEETKLEVGDLKISELIRQWSSNSSLKNYVLKETENTFGKTYGNCYDFKINEIVIFGDKEAINFGCINLPSGDGNVESICVSIEKYQNKLEENFVGECFE